MKKLTKKIYQYTAVFEPDKSGAYTATIPALPGCISEGDNFEDALKNIGEAAELYLEDVKMDKALEQFAKEAQEIIVAPIKVAV
ncbi:MAG: hypothetical protein UW30_C0008G0005 [Candidatus Giovannonibacteria bacterium GW2011_GWA2_44_13b]|uniref:HicB-like antitoxin of toxin-antitoxin system domain-containing protein n=2 Tax=Candidatus Giovannoniibacteriota TaxID=1752738 RepID=A0A0G1H1Z1_9BACT|nr:MAG: hypothetical protein UW30_C0008G0005 [Candidatus Giovannonibacteria bacterium GW2011_GWA2_44_13b]OGF82654.1 MAG: hypothetical protein A2924_00620 [Candidatus Giovannonibacteria bacterium RIFCSPLOWO2_01_FULL_44_16]